MSTTKKRIGASAVLLAALALVVSCSSPSGPSSPPPTPFNIQPSDNLTYVRPPGSILYPPAAVGPPMIWRLQWPNPNTIAPFQADCYKVDMIDQNSFRCEGFVPTLYSNIVYTMIIDDEARSLYTANDGSWLVGNDVTMDGVVLPFITCPTVPGGEFVGPKSTCALINQSQ